jgi:hypothetical protein
MKYFTLACALLIIGALLFIAGCAAAPHDARICVTLFAVSFILSAISGWVRE